jgi:SAM-dependent methyltransferase
VIISNCVVNLSPEKPAVIKDAYRALKPGGRLAISDIVATQPLPDQVRENLALVSGCVGGAAEIADLEKMLQDAGFRDIQIQPHEESRRSIRTWFPEHPIDAYIVSASIKAKKPG